MNMTTEQISAAYRAVLELSNIVLPYKAARGIASLKKRLAEENDVVAEMEKKIVLENGGTVKSGGACDFPDAEAARRFQEAILEARKQADDIRLPTVDLSGYTELIRISPSAIEALDGIVLFEKGGGADG